MRLCQANQRCAAHPNLSPFTANDYALHPAFAEASLVEVGTDARPAFPDNLPRIRRRGRTVYVNGLYRHGFLLAPVLAELVADYVDTGAVDPEVFVADPAQR